MNTDALFIIADNQDITRAGLHDVVRSIFSDYRLEDVSDKKGLIQVLTEHGVGVVILDYALFDISGIDELLVIRNRFPAAYWVLFSNELSEELIRRLSAEPNISMILKENPGDEIRSALICAVRGQRFLCHQITNLLISGFSKPEVPSILTATETDILRLIAHGKSVKEIAVERNSSIHTIITHKKNIFRKLDVNNVYEATKYALRAGLVELVEYYI